jgi:cyclase
MLKIRVMPTLLYKDYGLVKGVAFDSWRRTGSAIQQIKVYEMRQVDELVFLDIAATVESRDPDYALIDDLADDCFMPLTVGGGVRSLEEARRLLQVGADKVAVNTAAVQDPAIVHQIARRFGSQCVVVSIDFRRGPDREPEVFTHSATRPAGIDPVSVAKAVEEAGAGEILLTSVDLDGTMTGYDLEMTRLVSEAVSIPVIASGGCGSYQDMADAVSQGGAAAVAAASIFHFTPLTPLEAKEHLRSLGLPVRLARSPSRSAG